MYASCGWFFDDLSGIETVQIIQYAGRAIQLAQEIFGDGLEGLFLERLSRARSNIPDHGDGGRIYAKFVKPAMVDWEKLGAHYAISSMFEAYPEQARVYCYRAEREDYRNFEAGKARLGIGRVKLTSDITLESAVLSFGVLSLGDHNVSGGVREFQGHEAYEALAEEVAEPFVRADFPEVLRLMDRQFGESNYSIRTLFRDEQRKILSRILESTLADAEAVHRRLYESHAPMMRFLTSLDIPLPGLLRATAECVLNAQLRQALESPDLDQGRVQQLLDAATVEGAILDSATLEYALRKNLEKMAAQFLEQPLDLPLLRRLEAACDLAAKLPFQTDLWRVENHCYRIFQKVYPEVRENAAAGDESARAWIRSFEALVEKLRILIA